MRRFLFWQLPAAAATIAAIVFAWGMAAYLRGDTGTPVELAPVSPPAAEAARTLVAPLVIGDSLAHGAGDESGLGISGRLDAELRRRHIPARRSWNLGIDGARTPDVLRELDSANVRALLQQSNVVVLSIGGNDLWGGTDWRNAPPRDPDEVMDGVLAHVAQAVETIRRASPRARIFVIGLYNPFAAAPFGPRLTPLVARWNARLIERFADDPQVTIVSTSDLFAYHDRLSADRFHPSGEGYELITRRIADAL